MEESESNNKWIFLIPVDGNINKTNSKNNNELLEQNKKEKLELTKEYSKNKNNYDKNVKDNCINIDNNCKIYSYSSITKSKAIMNADSSKLYVSEFLKKNWKIKIKRLRIKLQKRYTKQSQKLLKEEPKININNSLDINKKININENKSINFEKFQNNYNICESKRFANNCRFNKVYNNFNYYNYYTYNFNNNYNNIK